MCLSTESNAHVLGISKRSHNPLRPGHPDNRGPSNTTKKGTQPLGWHRCSLSMSSVLKKAKGNSTAEVSTLMESTAQRKRWIISYSLSKGLLSRWHCPFHILQPCFRGGRPKEPVQRCMSKTFLIHFSCHTNTVLIIILPLTSCSSFISILCPIESSSYPIGRGLVNQMRKFLSFHNLPLAEILLNALTQNQGGLFQELMWSYVLLNLEIILCILLISGATITSAKCQLSLACRWLWDMGTTYRQ